MDVTLALSGSSGIEDVIADSSHTTGIYDQKGVRVTPPDNDPDLLLAEIYIINGNKIIIQ